MRGGLRGSSGVSSRLGSLTFPRCISSVQAIEAQQLQTCFDYWSGTLVLKLTQLNFLNLSNLSSPTAFGLHCEPFHVAVLDSVYPYFFQICRVPYKMEMELAESHSSPPNDKGPTFSEISSPPENDKRPGLFNRQRTSKDESVIARFGKRQQLRVGALLIIGSREKASTNCIPERIWPHLSN